MNDHDIIQGMNTHPLYSTVVSGDALTMEKINEMMKIMSNKLTPYELAERTMNEELKKKGLPNMDTIVDGFYESHPEYEL